MKTTTPELPDWHAFIKILAKANDPVQCVKELDVSHEALMAVAVVAENGHPYGRNVLYAGDLGEVLLVRWSNGQFCALHDHGEGAGVICFIEGDYEEEFWKWNGERLVCEGRVERRAGEACYIHKEVVHRVIAPRGGMSLHFYIPGSSGMRIFDVENRRTLRVDDDCGAWIDESKIKEVIQWD